MTIDTVTTAGEVTFHAFTRHMLAYVGRIADMAIDGDGASTPLRWRLENVLDPERAAKNVGTPVNYYSSPYFTTAGALDLLAAAYTAFVSTPGSDLSDLSTLIPVDATEPVTDTLTLDEYPRVWSAVQLWSEAVMATVETTIVQSGHTVSRASLMTYSSVFGQAIRDVVIAALVQPETDEERRSLRAGLTSSKIIPLRKGPLRQARILGKTTGVPALPVVPATSKPAEVEPVKPVLAKTDHRGERYAMYLADDLNEDEALEVARGLYQYLQHFYPALDLDALKGLAA